MKFSPRERAFLGHLSREDSLKAVAQKMRVSDKAAQYDCARLKQKLGLSLYGLIRFSLTMKKLILLWLIPAALPLSSAQVTLAWDASPDANVSGYRIYWGSNSRQYTNSQTTGLITTNTVSGLQPGIRYYFAATAHTTNDIESDFSNEVVWYATLPSVQNQRIK